MRTSLFVPSWGDAFGSSSTRTRVKGSASSHLTLPSMPPSSRRLLRNFMPSLKAKPGSGCAVETKVIGQYSPQHSDWHVQCGPKMQIFSVLASRCGLQIESRFFSKDKQSHLNLRMNDV